MMTYRSGARTRRDILDVAQTLFADCGYHPVSVQEIAEAADCSKAAVLYHFKTKGDILAAVVEPIVAYYRLLSARLVALPPGPAQFVAIGGLVELVITHPRAAAVMARDLSDVINHEALADLREAGAFLPGALTGHASGPEASLRAKFAIHGAISAAGRSDLDQDQLREHLFSYLTAVLIRPAPETHIDTTHPSPSEVSERKHTGPQATSAA